MAYMIVFILGVLIGAVIANKGLRDKLVKQIRKLSEKKEAK